MFLIKSKDLYKLIGNSNVRILDCRWNILKPEEALINYINGHVPKAKFVDVHNELAEHYNGGPGRHPIPSKEKWLQFLNKFRIEENTSVYLYDDTGGTIAARCWWLLRYYGHTNVSLLDGGFIDWKLEGLPLETIEKDNLDLNLKYNNHTVNIKTDLVAFSERVASMDYVKNRKKETILIDARANERFTGKFEPIDKKAGHIPGAINIPTSSNLTGNFFKSPNELQQLYNSFGVKTDSEVIVYCGSGVTACHNIFSLSLAGFPEPKLYEGSWSDWSSVQENSIEI